MAQWIASKLVKTNRLKACISSSSFEFVVFCVSVQVSDCIEKEKFIVLLLLLSCMASFSVEQWNSIPFGGTVLGYYEDPHTILHTPSQSLLINKHFMFGGLPLQVHVKVENYKWVFWERYTKTY